MKASITKPSNYLRDEARKIAKHSKAKAAKATDPAIKDKYRILEEEFSKLARQLDE